MSSRTRMRTFKIHEDEDKDEDRLLEIAHEDEDEDTSFCLMRTICPHEDS